MNPLTPPTSPIRMGKICTAEDDRLRERLKYLEELTIGVLVANLKPGERQELQARIRERIAIEEELFRRDLTKQADIRKAREQVIRSIDLE